MRHLVRRFSCRIVIKGVREILCIYIISGKEVGDVDIRMGGGYDVSAGTIRRGASLGGGVGGGSAYMLVVSMAVGL